MLERLRAAKLFALQRVSKVGTSPLINGPWEEYKLEAGWTLNAEKVKEEEEEEIVDKKAGGKQSNAGK